MLIIKYELYHLAILSWRAGNDSSASHVGRDCRSDAKASNAGCEHSRLRMRAVDGGGSAARCGESSKSLRKRARKSQEACTSQQFRSKFTQIPTSSPAKVKFSKAVSHLELKSFNNSLVLQRMLFVVRSAIPRSKSK